MSTPNRAARRRAERTQTPITPEREQQELQNRINQAIASEQAKTGTALKALDVMMSSFELIESELGATRQQVAAFAGQLEDSDRELDEALVLVGEFLATDEAPGTDLPARAQAFLDRLLEPEAVEPAAEETVTPITRKRTTKPKADTNGEGKVDQVSV